MPSEVKDEKTRARKLARERLKVRLEGEGSAWAQKLEKCGALLSLTCCCCGHERTVEKRCDLKWCPACAPALVHRTVTAYRASMEAIQWPLFVTLTTVNFKTGPQCIREVRRALGKLRRLVWWKRHVVGGVAAVEVTNRGKGWHPHVHMLLDCKWLAVSETAPAPNANKSTIATKGKRACSEVAQQWTLCMGGRRSSCKVRRVWKRDGGDIMGALAEVMKYSVTAENLLSIKDDLTPLLDVLDKTRMLSSFGSIFGKLPKRVKGAAQPCDKCHSSDAWLPTDVVDADLSRLKAGKSSRNFRS